MNNLPQNLPVLRADLEVTLAPAAEDGKPVWMIHDPINATFTQIDWMQFEIVKRLDKPQSFEELLERIYTNTTLRENAEDIKEFVGELIRADLTTLTLYKSTANLLKMQEARKQGFFQWLIFHYLYFRVPVFNPDKFLEKTLGVFKVFSSRLFFIFYTFITLAGIFFLTQHFEEYLHTFTDFFNPRGAFIYAGTIALLKIAHEFSHAYTAKLYKNRVPAIGLAFIVMWPIPYCDVTDSWRMDSRSRRLKISAAGIIIELIIAGFALFIWGISRNDNIRSITFVLSSITLLSTLFVNLNPLMRFDGYYIFSDLTAIDNLQSRAFAMTRWFYRSKFLGLSTDCPEPDLSGKRKFFMIVYSFSTWTYRFFLYTGIALIVYYTFPKAIGIFLFSIEIMMFLVLPLCKELTADYQLINRKRISIRFALFIILLCSLIIWASLPLSRYATLPAITSTENLQVIFSPYSGIIQEQKISRDSKVKKGDLLLKIQSPDLQAQVRLYRLAVEQLALEIKQLYATPEMKSLIPQKKESYLRAKAQLRALEETAEQTTVNAEISGTVTEYKPTLRDGIAVFQREELGKIYDLDSMKLIAYATADEIKGLKEGEEIIFIPNYASYSRIEYRVIITNIRPTRSEYLIHPELSSFHGGSLSASPDKEGRLKLLKSYFEIECIFVAKPAELKFGQPGRLKYWSQPRSYLKELLIHLHQTLMRESGI